MMAVDYGGFYISLPNILSWDDHNPLRESANQWIGLRENLQETIDFPIKYGAFL